MSLVISKTRITTVEPADAPPSHLVKEKDGAYFHSLCSWLREVWRIDSTRGSENWETPFVFFLDKEADLWNGIADTNFWRVSRNGWISWTFQWYLTNAVFFILGWQRNIILWLRIVVLFSCWIHGAWLNHSLILLSEDYWKMGLHWLNLVYTAFCFNHVELFTSSPFLASCLPSTFMWLYLILTLGFH